MAQLRQHKAFSDIEQDIKRYYQDGTVDVLTTALKVAGRALAVAHATAPDNKDINKARQLVFDQLLNEHHDGAIR
jgi:hypothetical protein